MDSGLRRAPWLLLAALLLAGCSATRLAYNRLDWLLDFEIARYVDLDAAQQRQVDAAFERAWAWHRREELPRYAAELRALAAASSEPLSAAQVADHAARLAGAWDRTLARLLPDSCALLATLGDAQVAELLDEIDADIAEYEADDVRPDEALLRADRARRLQRLLRRWIGALRPEQRALALRWNEERPLANAAWLAHRRLWRGAFAGALSQRTGPAFCADLDLLLRRSRAVDSDDIRAVLDANRQRWFELIAQLSHTLDEAQRGQLRSELLDLAEDLEALAAQNPSAARL